MLWISRCSLLLGECIVIVITVKKVFDLRAASGLPSTFHRSIYHIIIDYGEAYCLLCKLRCLRVSQDPHVSCEVARNIYAFLFLHYFRFPFVLNVVTFAFDVIVRSNCPNKINVLTSYFVGNPRDGCPLHSIHRSGSRRVRVLNSHCSARH